MKNLQDHIDRHVLLIDFFENLKEELTSKVQILALRPKLLSTIESNFDGDFDFIVKKEDVCNALLIIYERCKISGVNFTLQQTFKNKRIFKFFLSDPEERCITLELWTAVEFTENGSTKSFTTASIFDAIEKKTASVPELLTLIYITHLHHKKKNIFSDENVYRFDVFTETLQGSENSLGSGKIVSLLDTIGNQNLSIEAANEKALQILYGTGLKTSNSLLQGLAYFLYRVRKKVFNLKRIVPVVGPDGAGKGIISDTALPRLTNWVPFRYKELYRIRKLYKLRWVLIRNRGSQPFNQLDEQINHYILFTSFVTIRLLPFLKRGKRILLDRYFLDYLATPIRYLNHGEEPQKIKFYRSMLRFTPSPNAMVFMGCKTSSLAERKNELPVVSIEFLQRLYCEFMLTKKVPLVLFLSTENEIELSSEALYVFLSRG